MKQYRGIVFDFDFTLADSSAGVLVCINHALASLGYPHVDKSRSDETIGLSLADTFVKLTGIADDTKAEQFRKLFLEKADAVMVDMTILLPGAKRVIPRLAERDRKSVGRERV